jgi:hypothetical protein
MHDRARHTRAFVSALALALVGLLLAPAVHASPLPGGSSVTVGRVTVTAEPEAPVDGGDYGDDVYLKLVKDCNKGDLTYYEPGSRSTGYVVQGHGTVFEDGGMTLTLEAVDTATHGVVAVRTVAGDVEHRPELVQEAASELAGDMTGNSSCDPAPPPKPKCTTNKRACPVLRMRFQASVVWHEKTLIPNDDHRSTDGHSYEDWYFQAPCGYYCNEALQFGIGRRFGADFGEHDVYNGGGCSFSSSPAEAPRLKASYGFGRTVLIGISWMPEEVKPVAGSPCKEGSSFYGCCHPPDFLLGADGTYSPKITPPSPQEHWYYAVARIKRQSRKPQIVPVSDEVEWNEGEYAWTIDQTGVLAVAPNLPPKRKR